MKSIKGYIANIFSKKQHKRTSKNLQLEEIVYFDLIFNIGTRKNGLIL